MSRLTAEIKLRVDPELKAELEARAERSDRTAAAIARRYIREGLTRDTASARRDGDGR